MSTQEENNQNIVFSYCTSENCTGTPTDAVADPDEDRECPICFNSIGGQRVTMLKPCRHFFCMECSKDYQENGTCPVCRATAKQIFCLSCPTISEQNAKDIRDHLDCKCNIPELKEYLECLDTKWFTFAKFMLQASKRGWRSYGLRGTETLKLQRLEEEGRLLYKGNNCLVLKTKQEEKQVVICVTMACLSIRLVITKQDDIDYEVDNAYADTVIGWMNIQMRACWRAIPLIINKKFNEKMFVRKFEKVNCFLLFTGFEDCGFYIYHYDNMRKELSTMKQNNFDETFYKKVRSIFPGLSIPALRYEGENYLAGCCNSEKGVLDEETGILFRKMRFEEVLILQSEN